MSDVWVVVASSTRCRIFAQQRHAGPLLPVEDLAHPESRLRNRDLNTDRPGRSFDSAGTGRHAMGQPGDAVEQENIRFAKAVVTTIEDGRKKTRFERLVLVVEPSFLGHLRHGLSSATRRLVSSELRKNLADEDPETIRQALPYRV